MIRNRNQLYGIVMIACVAGYAWLFYNLTNTLGQTADVCLFKRMTQLPCPSCGATRAVISIAHGDFITALNLNPIGYIVACIMLLAPLWIVLDLGLKKNTFFLFFQKLETQLRRPYYAIPLVLLVLVNWIWNISKSL